MPCRLGNRGCSCGLDAHSPGIRNGGQGPSGAWVQTWATLTATMRHFLILLIVLPLGYGLWRLGSRPTQRLAARWLLRIAALALVLLALLVLTYQTTALKLL
jgi:hypothetical protein